MPGAANNGISEASNVISGNRGSGIAIDGSTGNRIVANYVGTDARRTRDLGNVGPGLLLDSGAPTTSSAATITFVNSTGQVPESNLFSGNGGCRRGA